MSDLDAIIQAAEETKAEIESQLPPSGRRLAGTHQVAADIGARAFATFIAKLKALRQGIRE